MHGLELFGCPSWLKVGFKKWWREEWWIWLLGGRASKEGEEAKTMEAYRGHHKSPVEANARWILGYCSTLWWTERWVLTSVKPKHPWLSWLVEAVKFLPNLSEKTRLLRLYWKFAWSNQLIVIICSPIWLGPLHPSASTSKNILLEAHIILKELKVHGSNWWKFYKVISYSCLASQIRAY